MTDDFNEFVDSVIVRAADRQDGARVEPIALRDLASELEPNVSPTWLELLEERLRKLHYGDLLRDSDLPGRFYFKINAAGLARAHEVRKARKKPRVLDRIRSAPWGKIAGDALKILSGAVVGHILK